MAGGQAPRSRISGGLVGGLWRERFAGTRRLVDNLVVAREAVHRGVKTAAPVALLALRGPRGLYRAWLATEEIRDTRDLARRFAEGPAPRPAELERAVAVVRAMHDAGIEHRDLNLGNLLLRDVPAEAWVVDLDRARLHAAPLSLRTRLAGLVRLERSYVKQGRARAQVEERVRRLWYELYAAGDSALARRLERGRKAWWDRSISHGEK